MARLRRSDGKPRARGRGGEVSTTHPVDQVAAYLEEVRARLVGVPDEEQAELLDDVAAHVREVADEHGADQLRERLGSPEQFGDELRTSAGFAPPASGATVQARAKRRIDTWRESKLWRRVVAEWPRLEPAWWLLRGVAVVWLVTGVAGGTDGLIPDTFMGPFVLVAGAATSYALAIRRPDDQSPTFRKARVVGEVLLAVFAFFFVLSAQQTKYVYYDSSSGAQPDACLRDSAGRAISNLFGYDLNGQLIPKFFLTDQAGRPIDNLCPDEVEAPGGGNAATTYARDVNGAPVYNVFPRAQQRTVMDEMTGEVRTQGPIVPPAVVFPQIDPNASASTTTTVPAVSPTSTP